MFEVKITESLQSHGVASVLLEVISVADVGLCFLQVFFHYHIKLSATDFSQMKNESKLGITFDEFGGFLVSLFNKVAQQKQNFAELFVSRHKTVVLEVLEKSGMKYTSLLKRELFRLDELILKRKINSMVYNEASNPPFPRCRCRARKISARCVAHRQAPEPCTLPRTRGCKARSDSRVQV